MASYSIAMRLFLSCICLIAIAVPARADNFGPPQWIQLEDAGAAELRLVTNSASCPTDTSRTMGAFMRPRASASPQFPLVCSGLLDPSNPALARVRDPQRIVVLGDTGCRIKPPALQACNDIQRWPFPELAISAARLKPDLVIHVGDYLYRESACPAGETGCAGTPFGDNWATWSADFFQPAAPLLAVAPVVFVRGNHEDCRRSGAGFMRLLSPVPFEAAAPCAEHLKPFAVPMASMSLVVMDDASAPDTSIAQNLVPAFRSDFAQLPTIAPPPLWLLMHRPIFGLIKGPFGIPVGGNLTMITALSGIEPFAHVSLMLSGHIHAFESINYAAAVPPQLLAGNGGDNLDITPRDLSGARFQGNSGVTVRDGISVGGFGFLLMTKSGTGWKIDLYSADGTREGECIFSAGRVDCPWAAPTDKRL